MRNLFEEKHTKYDPRGIKALDIPKINATKFRIQYLSYLNQQITVESHIYHCITSSLIRPPYHYDQHVKIRLMQLPQY